MNLTESILEDAALTWFQELGYAVAHGPHIAPGEPTTEGHKPEDMDTETAALFPTQFQDSETGPIPKGWTALTQPEAIDVNPRRKLTSGTVAPHLDMKNVPTRGHCAEDVTGREFKSGTKFQNGDTLLPKLLSGDPAESGDHRREGAKRRP